MDIDALVSFVNTMPQCAVRLPQGYPAIDIGHVLPTDLARFYSLCGGLDLFQDASFPMYISGPHDLVLANPVIFHDLGLNDTEISSTKDHESWSWYIIAKDSDLQYVTIDLNQQRLGRCYDSFWDRHPGNSRIIATSFTQLIQKLIDSKGEVTVDRL